MCCTWFVCCEWAGFGGGAEGLWFASPGCVIVLVGVVGIKCAFGVPSGSSKLDT